ncbi:unnamed protein product [Hapterophycus canaliculatus]
MQACSPAGVTVWSTGLQIYRQHGLFNGCYRGFSSMLLKEGLGNTVYFGSYEICKQQAFTGESAGTGAGAERDGQAEQARPGVGPIVAAGGCAGVMYTAVTHPIDTVKSLLQTDSMKAPRYRGFLDGWRQVLAPRSGGSGGRKGFLGLYRGLSPAIARAFVGNSILFLTYENVLDALGR